MNTHVRSLFARPLLYISGAKDQERRNDLVSIGRATISILACLFSKLARHTFHSFGSKLRISSVSSSSPTPRSSSPFAPAPYKASSRFRSSSACLSCSSNVRLCTSRFTCARYAGPAGMSLRWTRAIPKDRNFRRNQYYYSGREVQGTIQSILGRTCDRLSCALWGCPVWTQRRGNDTQLYDVCHLWYSKREIDKGREEREMEEEVF